TGFDGACLILALLVFAMTFPGGLARETEKPGDLMLEIATGWLAILALLGLPLILPRVLAAEGLHKVAVIAGANDLGRKLGAGLGDPMLATRVAGYFDDRGAERLHDLPAAQNLGPLARLADYARTHRVDVIYIALPMASQPRILRLLEDLRDTTASIYFVP